MSVFSLFNFNDSNHVLFVILVLLSLTMISIFVRRIIYNYKVSKKNKEILHAVQLVCFSKVEISKIQNKNIDNKKNDSDNLLYTGEHASTDLFHIYLSSTMDQKFLDVLSERWPHALKDYSATDYIDRFENKSTVPVVSNFAGQRAEDIAIKHYEHLGYQDVNAFESKTHPNDDFYYTDFDGHIHNVSVKTYGSLYNFKRAVDNHPASTEYCINSELYQKAKESGYLDELQQHGIKVVDGGFFNDSLRDSAENVIDNITSVDVIHDTILNHTFGTDFIDFTEAGINSHDHFFSYGLEYKLLKTSSSLFQGKQTTNDFVLNVGEAIFSKKAALVGAKTGATIGTVGGPIGSFIGGIIGTIGGAMGGGSAYKTGKDIFAYQEIIQAASFYAFAYKSSEQKINNQFILELTLIDFNKIEKKQKKIIGKVGHTLNIEFTIDKTLAYITLSYMIFLTSMLTEILDESEGNFRNSVKSILDNKKIKQDLYPRYMGAALIQAYPKPDEFLIKTYDEFINGIKKYKEYPYIFPKENLISLKNIVFAETIKKYTDLYLDNIEEAILLQKKPLYIFLVINVVLISFTFIFTIGLLVESQIIK